MPSWPIHLALANKINKKLNLGDDFIIGNVMPDVTQGYIIENPSKIISKEINHFQDKSIKPPSYNIKGFIDKYNANLNNPLIKGYLSHLITDKFFNEYTYKNHYLLVDGKYRAILNNGTIQSDFSEKAWQIKQRDFGLLGQKLTNDGMLPIINIKNKDSIKIIEECPLDDSDIDKTISKINELALDKGVYDSNKYEMFTEEELMKLFDDCYDYILDTLKSFT